MRASVGGSFVLCLASLVPAIAAEPVDQAYIRSLAAPGKTVLVVEYYDGQGSIAERKGFASTSGFKAVSPIDFRVDSKTVLRLYGIEPCEGDLVNRREDFSGTCADYARKGLGTLLQSPKVIFCRAFVSEANAPLQDATCYGYYNYPGSVDTVDMFEEQLVSVGSHRVARNPDGTAVRKDLAEAEQIGRGGYGMWADPRIKAQAQ
ncbi:hypothetical protein LB516_20640 [Mesorhizobium sp. CO1-1-7]|uniref:hypothetical protein n=1 Tax=Mesorhizobium sp. CO1-1-7 TaxID=2876632 RepID=UPI001CD16087|nr:hypothetical protein [Mesorhizobium sp. CO1-1-7]MBZ9747658.1 hypothetical protein [Mesorhizobium sp. CO1-1-7]